MFASNSAPIGAIFLFAGLVVATGEPAIITTTIPYLGSCTNTITWEPCGGQTIVVIETPIAVPVCSTTVTSTSTSSAPTWTPTPNGPCQVKPFCAAAGLDIDYYSNPLGGYSSGKPPSSYYITEGLKPLDSSLTNTTFFPQNYGAPAGSQVVYPVPKLPYYVGWKRDTNGGVTVDANNFTVVYEGFYRAPTTGTYSLCATADNEDDVFFGHGNALNCLDGKAPADAKPLLSTTGGNYINGIVCKTVDLVAGWYYPVRNVMGNYQGPSAFNFTIQAPGVAEADRTHDFAGLVYPLSCGLFL
jgi:hypothetical protein